MCHKSYICSYGGKWGEILGNYVNKIQKGNYDSTLREYKIKKNNNNKKIKVTTLQVWYKISLGECSKLRRKEKEKENILWIKSLKVWKFVYWGHMGNKMGIECKFVIRVSFMVQ